MNNPTVNFEIGELFRTKFSLFDTYSEDVRKEQIKKICYIADIADQLGKNIYGVNLFELFNNNNNILLDENSAINRTLAMFNREEFVKKQEVELLSDENIESIGISYNEKFRASERNMRDNIYYHFNEAQVFLRRHKEELKKASMYRRKKAELVASSPSKVIDSINKLLETGKYKVHNVTRHSVEMIILDDIIMTYKKPSIDVDLRVNLGQFKLQISFDDGLRINVKAFENNVFVGSKYHPHLSGCGDVCLGNMQEIHDEAIVEDDIFTAVDAISKVLHTYYDGDPYVIIDEFVIESKQIQPNGKILESEVRQQSHDCPECDSEVAVNFRSGDDTGEAECLDCEYSTEYEFDYDRED